MKPEPVRPLHGSILRAQKNCKLPLISKKVKRGPQPLPLRCPRSWAGMGCQKQSLPCQGRTKPWNLLYRWKSKVISPKAANHSCWANTKGRPPESLSTAKSRAQADVAHELPCFAHLGEPELPYGCSSNLQPQGWVEFPLIYSNGGKCPVEPKCFKGEQNQCLGLCVLCTAEGTLSLFNRLEILIIDIKI